MPELPKACHGWHDIQREHRCMKWIPAILILIAAGCSDHNNREASPHRVRNESAINLIVDNFVSDYESAKSPAAKDSVMTVYRKKTDDFLLDHALNHMRVHVDSVIVKHLTIDTKFHAGKNLVFYSSMEFHKHMPRVEDSLFQLMKNLKQGTDTNLDFIYIGKFELHRPDDSLKPAMVVNAYPLSYQVHGSR
jgi:hypothetical protein